MSNIVQFRPDPGPATTAASGNQWIDLVAPAADLAKMIAATEFVPAEMRNKPAVVTACILYGAEIGIGPMQSLAKIDMVKGRPAPRAELARALALAAGHELWVDESTNTRVKISGRRRGSDHVQSVTWTMDDAKRAGLSSGTNYAKYPRAMLLARASIELVKMMCPDALGGITLFAEEMDDADRGDETSAAAAVEAVGTSKRRRTPYTAPVAVEATETPEAAPESADASITDAQVKKLMAGFNDAGLSDRDDRLKFTVAVVGRQITSSKELTRDEASKVIDACVALSEGRVGVVIAEDETWALTVVESAVEEGEQGELLVPGDEGWSS